MIIDTLDLPEYTTELPRQLEKGTAAWYHTKEGYYEWAIKVPCVVLEIKPKTVVIAVKQSSRSAPYGTRRVSRDKLSLREKRQDLFLVDHMPINWAKKFGLISDTPNVSS